MGRKHKYTKEVKLKAILDYENGVKSIIQLSNELDCSNISIRAWIRGYRAQGDDFFNNKTKGSAVRRLKWHASWVQNVVRQFGPYLLRA